MTRRREEAEGRRQEAGGRRQEAGGRRQEAGGRREFIDLLIQSGQVGLPWNCIKCCCDICMTRIKYEDDIELLACPMIAY